MQHNNEDQFRSLRTKNIKIWRKNIISFSKKKKEKDSYLPPPLCGLKKKNDELPSGIKIHPSPPPILWEHNYIGALNCHV